MQLMLGTITLSSNLSVPFFTRQIQTDGEVNRLYQVRTKMLTQLEEKERKLTQFQLLVSQLEMKNKQLSNALKAEKEEVSWNRA